MFLKSYRVNILFRILLLIISITLFLYCMFIIHKHLRAFYVFVLISLQSFEFFYFTDKVNRDLSNFMLAVTNNDFSSHFEGLRGNSPVYESGSGTQGICSAGGEAEMVSPRDVVH